MERAILQKLLDWKNSPYRKPPDIEGGAPGGENLGTERIQQALL